MGNSIERQKIESEREKMRLAAEIEMGRIFGAVTVSGKRLINSPKVHDDIIMDHMAISIQIIGIYLRMIPTV